MRGCKKPSTFPCGIPGGGFNRSAAMIRAFSAFHFVRSLCCSRTRTVFGAFACIELTSNWVVLPLARPRSIKGINTLRVTHSVSTTVSAVTDTGDGSQSINAASSPIPMMVQVYRESYDAVYAYVRVRVCCVLGGDIAIGNFIESVRFGKCCHATVSIGAYKYIQNAFFLSACCTIRASNRSSSQ